MLQPRGRVSIITVAPEASAVLTLSVLAGMFVLFVRGRFSPEVVAVGGVAVLLITGVLETDRMLAAIANPAPVTIAAMFILTGALVRTGALDRLTQLALARAASRPVTVLAALALATVAASAFMNNTPVVAILIPVAFQLARVIGVLPSRLLIPLSYAAILGGACTLLGTSTNLLVDGVARAQGLAPFGLFEIAPLGLVAAVTGLSITALLARRLPERASVAGLTRDRKQQRFFTELAIAAGSSLAGKPVGEVALFRRGGARVIDVLRGEESLRRALPDVTLVEGDRVVLRTSMQDVLTLRESGAFTAGGDAGALVSRSSITVEALIGPGCRLAGRTLGRLRLRRRYGVYPLAVHRRGESVARRLDDIRIQIGDTLLLEGTPEDIRRLSEEADLVDLNTPAERPFRPRKAPVAIAALTGVVALAALSVMPIAGLAVIAVAAVLLTGAIDADEALGFVEGRVLLLVLSMLAVGAAMEDSGAVALILRGLEPALDHASPRLALLIIYLMTVILTELVTNNAVAVIMTPIAIGAAQAAGLDPRPFVVAVMFGASASFMTPVGYQTNMLVYTAGGYRFGDFARIGAPVGLGVGAVVIALAPVIWPF